VLCLSKQYQFRILKLNLKIPIFGYTRIHFPKFLTSREE